MSTYSKNPDAIAKLRTAVESAGAALVSVDCNPIDKAWGDDRPAQPQASVVPHPLEYAGEPSSAKRAALAQVLKTQNADVVVLTTPASVAWLFNIRGGDVIRTPLPLSQAIVRSDASAQLFIDPAKVTSDLAAWLGPEVSLRAADDLPDALEALSKKRVLLDPASAVAWYFDVLSEAGAEVIRAADPTVLPRAIKNPVEVAGARAAHVRDGAALTRFLHWIATEAQTSLPDEVEIVTIVDVGAVWSDPATPWIRHVVKTAEDTLGESFGAAPRTAPYFTDASVLTPALGNPPTIILGPGEAGKAHQTDEYCAVDLIHQATAIYAKLAADWVR